MASRPWTDEEAGQLRQLVGERREFSEIAKAIGRTPGSIAKKSQELGLRKPAKGRSPWSDDQARAASTLDWPIFAHAYPGVSYDAYHSKRFRVGVIGLELTDYTRLVEELDGDAVVCACVHCPQTDPVMWSRALAVGQRDKIENLVVAGDIVTGDMFSHWSTKEVWAFDKELESLRQHLVSALGIFKYIYITPGNHVSNRIVTITNGHIRLKHLIDMAGLMDLERARIFTTEIDFLRLESGGETFYIGHAANYSRIGGKVPTDYAERELAHVIIGNGHRTGLQATRSGRYFGFEIGMMADDRFMGYAKMRLNNYPKMQRSFATVRNGAVKLYGEGLPMTDWGAELAPRH